MKKNGFIATSLIYTFFIMFVVLFSSVMAKYMNNKTNVEMLEKNIKNKLNTIIGLRDFDVGEMVGILENGNCENLGDSKIYIVSNIDTFNSEIILYSYDLYIEGDLPYDEILTYDNLLNDISEYGGYYNPTYFDKIIYMFDKTKNDFYSIADNYYAYKKNDVDDNSLCTNFISDKWCLSNKLEYGIQRYRKRLVLSVEENITKCNVDSGDGTIYLEMSL